MPKKPLRTTPRERRPVSEIDFEDTELLTYVEDLAYQGYYDGEIADKLNVDRYEFSRAKKKFEKLAQTLESARARAREEEVELPSPPLFAEVWESCGRRRSKLMKAFGIGWTKLQSWLAQEPVFNDIMAESDLDFLEQADMAGRILSLGGVEGKDNFPGWKRYPDPYMIRFNLNTLGRRYGYGENPVLPKNDLDDIPANPEQGIDIESWIKQEMAQKKQQESDDN